uniref:RING-type domain-containing protein n=1 Tax=Globodera rostochiensis TaxID=31243 RepID=A0A914HWB9_GLORO
MRSVFCVQQLLRKGYNVMGFQSRKRINGTPRKRFRPGRTIGDSALTQQPSRRICTLNFDITDISALKCGHTYHYECIDKWIMNSKTCPNCRTTNIRRDITKLFFDECDKSFSQFPEEPINTELVAELKKIRDEKMALELTVKEHKEKLVFFDLKLKQEKAKGDQHALQLQTKKQHIRHLESQLFDQSILKEKNDTYKRRIVASDFYAHLMKNGGDDEDIDKYIKLNGQPDEAKFLKLMRNQRDEEIKKNKKLGSEIKKERLERCKREKEVGELRKENEELRKENEKSKKRKVDGAGGTTNSAQYQTRPSFGFSFTDPNDKGEVVHAAKNFAFEGDSSVEILSGSDKPSTYSNTNYKILDQFDPIHLSAKKKLPFHGLLDSAPLAPAGLLYSDHSSAL